jgi:hypothetical protein
VTAVRGHLSRLAVRALSTPLPTTTARPHGDPFLARFAAKAAATRAPAAVRPTGPALLGGPDDPAPAPPPAAEPRRLVSQGTSNRSTDPDEPDEPDDSEHSGSEPSVGAVVDAAPAVPRIELDAVARPGPPPSRVLGQQAGSLPQDRAEASHGSRSASDASAPLVPPRAKLSGPATFADTPATADAVPRRETSSGAFAASTFRKRAGAQAAAGAEEASQRRSTPPHPPDAHVIPRPVRDDQEAPHITLRPVQDDPATAHADGGSAAADPFVSRIRGSRGHQSPAPDPSVIVRIGRIELVVPSAAVPAAPSAPPAAIAPARHPDLLAAYRPRSGEGWGG